MACRRLDDHGNCKNGVSSYEIGRAIGVTQKSAWFMLHRIRLAMQRRSLMKLGGNGGEVEVDETFIGGKARIPTSGVHGVENSTLAELAARPKFSAYSTAKVKSE